MGLVEHWVIYVFDEVSTGFGTDVRGVCKRLWTVFKRVEQLREFVGLAGVDVKLFWIWLWCRVCSMLLVMVDGKVKELSVLSNWYGEFSTHVEVDGECSTLVVVIVDLGFYCGECSRLVLLSSNLTTLSTRLYSVLVLIFQIAWELLPRILDAAWLTSRTFFSFNSIIISVKKWNSGSVHWKLLVFFCC